MIIYYSLCGNISKHCLWKSSTNYKTVFLLEEYMPTEFVNLTNQGKRTTWRSFLSLFFMSFESLHHSCAVICNLDDAIVILICSEWSPKPVFSVGWWKNVNAVGWTFLFLTVCPRIGQGFSLLLDCRGGMGQAVRQAQGLPKSAWLRSARVKARGHNFCCYPLACFSLFGYIFLLIIMTL